MVQHPSHGLIEPRPDRTRLPPNIKKRNHMWVAGTGRCDRRFRLSIQKNVGRRSRLPALSILLRQPAMCSQNRIVILRKLVHLPATRPATYRIFPPAVLDRLLPVQDRSIEPDSQRILASWHPQFPDVFTQISRYAHRKVRSSCSITTTRGCGTTPRFRTAYPGNESGKGLKALKKTDTACDQPDTSLVFLVFRWRGHAGYHRQTHSPRTMVSTGTVLPSA